MKNEYLITFDSKEKFCSTVETFKKLLETHENIIFKDSENISYDGDNFLYKLAQGRLPDDSIYFDFTIEYEESSNNKNPEKFKDLVREVKQLCSRVSARQIISLQDGIGEEYCRRGYPIIYKTESLMRKLIAKFMAISIGYDWSDLSTPKEVAESIRIKDRRENVNFLLDIDFIQLSNFLFKEYTTADSNRFIQSLKDKKDEESISVSELRQFAPFTNWQKYFAERVNCESGYLKTRWEKLYEYRCKIAHCKGITQQELHDLTTISEDLCQKIQAALDSINDVHVEEAEREELAENISGAANPNVAGYLGMYNKLSALVKLACEKASSENDVYNKHETNKTNIKMQSQYLSNTKGLISKDEAKAICEAQTFRNNVVHRAGIDDIGESQFVEKMGEINMLIERFSRLTPEELYELKGINLRNIY